MSRSLRLPLAVGISSLNNAAAGVMAIHIGVMAVGVGLFAELAGPFFGIAAGGALLAVVGVRAIRRAWRTRPSDVVFDEAALRIAGGPLDRLTLGWDRIDPESSAVTEGHSDVGASRTKLLVGERGRGRRIVAEAEDPVEADSLREILAVVKARAEPDAPGAETAPPAVLLGCNRCGAPIAPADVATVACPYCRAGVQIPEPIRERVRGGTALRNAGTTIEKLLDQPGAEGTSRVLAMAALFIGSALPLALAALLRAWWQNRLDFWVGLGISLLPLLLIADGFFFARARLVDRRALGPLQLSFAARPADRAGGPLACRSCLGPLPASASSGGVVGCPFCGADNVLGVDLRGRGARALRSGESLADALSARERERRRWRLLPFLSVPLLAVTIAALYRLFVS